MNYTSLKYFLAVCQEKNITHAAQKLYITQQSLSEHISRLEKEYHVKLFERKPEFRLTYAGQQLQKLAEQAVTLDKTIGNEMSDIAMEKRGSLSIGMRPTYSRLFLPLLLPEFIRTHPSVELNVTIGFSTEIIGKLLDNRLDLVIASSKIAEQHPHLISEDLLEDYNCMIIPGNLLEEYFGIHPDKFDFQKNNLDYSRLGEVPFLLTERNKSTRNWSDKFLAMHGVERPRILLETRDLEANFVLCAEGVGVTFSYYQYYRYFVKHTLSRYPLFAVPINTQSTAPKNVILRNPGNYFSNAARDFLNLAKISITRL